MRAGQVSHRRGKGEGWRWWGGGVRQAGKQADRQSKQIKVEVYVKEDAGKQG